VRLRFVGRNPGFRPDPEARYSIPSMRRVMLISTLLVAGSALMGETRGPWDLERLREPPAVTWVRSSGPQRPLYYQGELFQGKPTRVFAYYAVPETGQPRYPAMVLVHGGGGTAFPHWATIWAQRGYAALAMDLSGRGPDGERLPDGGPEQSEQAKFRGHAQDVREAWSYHSAAAILRAVSLLRSLPEVDPERIGITGISWGGYLTSLVAGLDDRLKVAIPVYGCGFLHENSVWLPAFASMPAKLREAWIENFEPSRYLANARLPMLWINGTNDFAYPLDSYRKSYNLPRGPRALRVTVNMPHGHAAGWEPLEIALFADQHLRGGTPLPALEPIVASGGKARVRYRSTLPLTKAELHYTTGTTVWWHQRRWQTVPARIGEAEIEADLPAEAAGVLFLTVTDLRGAVVSTEHLEIEPRP
jgi:dienelactone hydrolase